jgi:signal peptidase I
MTVQPYQSEEQPPLLLGQNGDAAGGDSGGAKPRNFVPGTGPPAPRPRRAPDYRLRGLDLDEQPLAVAPPPTIPTRHPRSRRRRGRLLFQWAVVLAVAALVAVTLRAWVVQPYSVSSSSMAPTLRAGTDVLVVKPSVLTGSISAGDIVVFHEPDGSRCGSGAGDSHQLVARVIGLPGETIRSVNGTISINGRRLREPGWYNPSFGELGPTDTIRTHIPAGSYFVMGDNRMNRCDSRSFGPIPSSSLIGTVVATIARDGHPSVHLM